MPVFLSSTACTPSPPLCSHQDPSPGSLLRPFSCGTSLFLSRCPAPSAHPSFPCHSVPLSPVMLRRTLRSVQAFRPTPTVPRVLPFHRCRFLSSRGDRHFSPPSVHYPLLGAFSGPTRGFGAWRFRCPGPLPASSPFFLTLSEFPIPTPVPAFLSCLFSDAVLSSLSFVLPGRDVVAQQHSTG